MTKNNFFISPENLQKGRGAQFNTDNQFLKQKYEAADDTVLQWKREEDESVKTQIIEIFPKTILSKNDSPDLGFDYSINPYNGCEHGCTYCYARNSHEYWGYSAGTDFEQKILVKKNAPQLLEDAFRTGKWKPQPIVLSGNTDCYQPVEKKLEITRRLLEIFLKYNHPVGIITKNSLILRDLDILKQLNERNLLRVVISVTTLEEEIRRIMEPRASSVQQRLKTIETLVANNIPVHVNMAPIIPGINSDEIFELVKTVGELGAYSVAYIMVRLNGQVAQIFEDWVIKSFPERAQKILSQIKESHSGKLNDSRWATRMKGEGKYAEQIADMFKIAKTRFIKESNFPPLDYQSFLGGKHGQISLF
jgi:DNA repair photolyase